MQLLFGFGLFIVAIAFERFCPPTAYQQFHDNVFTDLRKKASGYTKITGKRTGVKVMQITTEESSSLN